jgi:acyl-CoA reductase-like NAD-dependent aldehyde dehydrogenase
MPTNVRAAFDLLPEVSEFLSQAVLFPFIGGSYVDPGHTKTFETFDPGSGAPLARVSSSGAPEVEAAVRAAEKAFNESPWPRLSAQERAVHLHRLADLVDRKKEVIQQLEALDCGKILEQAAWDVSNFTQTLRYYADLSTHVQLRTPLAVSGHEAWTSRQPWGVCAFIFPWNFPLLLFGWGTAPALAAGNTIVVKPAEDTPLSSLYLGRLCQEVGIPDGVVNVVPGFGETAGAALTNHPRIKRMSFTGSPEVGRLVATACGQNLVPVKLELGGKGAALVFRDIDLEDTAQKLVGAITFHSGQVCCTASRWIVQKEIYDKFVVLCADKMERLNVGHGMEQGTNLGPVVSDKQRRRVLGYEQKGQEQGAELLTGGGTATVAGYEEGFYVKPALLAGDMSNVAAREEIFGPVAFLTPFETEEEGIRLVNSTNYGLANSVWTNNPERAMRVAESMVAGNSWVNAHNLFPHGVPYGGVNLSGMGGGVLGPDTLFDYLRAQSIVRPI